MGRLQSAQWHRLHARRPWLSVDFGIDTERRLKCRLSRKAHPGSDGRARWPRAFTFLAAPISRSAPASKYDAKLKDGRHDTEERKYDRECSVGESGSRKRQDEAQSLRE